MKRRNVNRKHKTEQLDDMIDEIHEEYENKIAQKEKKMKEMENKT